MTLRILQKNKCFEMTSNFLKNNKNISTVIVSFRWVTSLPGIGYGNFAELYSKIIGEDILKKGLELLLIN